MNEIPNIAKKRLTASNAAARQEIGSHLDANLLSAFAENSLRPDGSERSVVVEHLSKCFECREALFLAQPEFADANIVHVTKSVRRWNAVRWTAWAACAVIVVVGATVITHRQAQQDPPQSQIAAMQAPSTAEPRSQYQMAPNTVTPETTVDPKRLDAKKPETIARVAKAPAAVANNKSQDMNMQMADAAPAAAKAAEASSSSNLPATRQAFATEMKSNSASGAGMAMLSKSSGPRWTLTAYGSLQRSLDSGKSWQAVTVAPDSTFRAIAAIGSEIWVGGPSGSLYHSFDAGDNWQHITPSSAGDTLTADITALSFPDAQHGSVTAGGETWTTSDAGQTWQKK
jgi:Photosynthesis system II assembly factor YCF48